MQYKVGFSIPAQKADGTKITLNVGDIIDVSGKSANGGYYLAKDSSGNDVQFPVKYWRQITVYNPAGGAPAAAPSPYHSGKPPVEKSDETAKEGFLEGISTVAKILTVVGLAGGIGGGMYYAHKNPASKNIWIKYVGFGVLGAAVGFGVGTGISKVSK